MSRAHMCLMFIEHRAEIIYSSPPPQPPREFTFIYILSRRQKKYFSRKLRC